MKVQIVLITDRRDIWYGTNNPVLIEFDFDIFKNYNNYLESKFYKAYHLSFKDYLLWNDYLKHIDVDAELFCDNKAIKNRYEWFCNTHDIPDDSILDYFIDEHNFKFTYNNQDYYVPAQNVMNRKMYIKEYPSNSWYSKPIKLKHPTMYAQI